METTERQAILALYDAGTTGIIEIAHKLKAAPAEIVYALQDNDRLPRAAAELTDEQLGAVLTEGCRRAFKYPGGWTVYNCRAYPHKEGKCYVCQAREEIDRRVAGRNSEGASVEKTA